MFGSDWVSTKPRQRLNRMSDQSQIHYKIIIPYAINSSLPPTSRLKQLTNDLSVRPRPTRIPGVAVNSSPSNQTSTYPELLSLILLLPQSEGKTVILIMEPPERLPLLRTNLWSWGDRNCWRHFISFEEVHHVCSSMFTCTFHSCIPSFSLPLQRNLSGVKCTLPVNMDRRSLGHTTGK